MSEHDVYLIDDDAALRDSVAFLLETEGFTVRAFASALNFLETAPAIRGGCIISDVRMPGMSGVQLARRLKEMQVEAPIIMITGHGDVPVAVEAMKAGVMDFLEKPFSDDALIKAVRAGLERGRAADAQGKAREEVRRRFAGLTEREKQVLRAVVAGQSNKDAAQALGISPRTVDIYRANVMTKMQAAS
ncbi:MAG: response regulator FixJ, partial [Hyphomonadaceae bacterium]